MPTADVVVAGGGISGLLIASALAPRCSVVLLEQSECLPINKYWLTDGKSVDQNSHLSDCIDRYYDYLDFVAYDGLTTRVSGTYCLWDTSKLIAKLSSLLSSRVRVLTRYRFYSLSYNSKGLVIRANCETINTRLLIDCMGFGSPLVGAKGIASIAGYYIMHGCEVSTRGEVLPVALDNVLINQQPTYFELFPTSKGTAHAAVILPSREYRPGRSLKGDLHFILTKSHYCQKIMSAPPNEKAYFGIIPVGRLRKPALDRIIFFGEAGQANPAASATGLSRMLRTYRELADAIEQCLQKDMLRQADLLRATPQYMTRMNRAFQETLFESLLSFNSDDFRRLVQELGSYSDELINDLIFAEFNFRPRNTLPLALDALLRRKGILGPNIVKSALRFLSIDRLMRS